MIRFRCKRSGNFITLYNENDIEGLRKCDHYEEMPDETLQHPSPKESTSEPVVPKRRGRPRRTE